MTALSRPEAVQQGRRTWRLSAAVVGVVASAWIVAAECLVAFGDLGWGLVLHAILLLALLNHHLFTEVGSMEGRRPATATMAMALALIPLLRLLSVAMPLRNVDEIYWYALVGAPLLFAMAMVARGTGLGERVGTLLRTASWRAVAVGAAAGVPLGLLAYSAAGAPALDAGSAWKTALLAPLLLVVFSAFLEEVLFRGLLREALLPVVGRGANAASAGLFGVVHLGAGPPVYALLAAAYGLAFGVVVEMTRSLAAVIAAHATLAIGLTLVWPRLFS